MSALWIYGRRGRPTSKFPGRIRRSREIESLGVANHIATTTRPRRGLVDVIREIAAEQRSRGFPGRSAAELRAEDEARQAEDAERDRELDTARHEPEESDE